MGTLNPLEMQTVEVSGARESGRNNIFKLSGGVKCIKHTEHASEMTNYMEYGKQ